MAAADETTKDAEQVSTRPTVIERTITREIPPDPPLGPNAKTEPESPKDHYYEISNGDGTFRHVNAWGEEKGSAEDKKRW